jgi:hypothetical protein
VHGNSGPVARGSTINHFFTKGDPLARSNYKFEKRQKEIAKQKKKEEKRQRKLERQPPEESDAENAPPPSGPE